MLVPIFNKINLKIRNKIQNVFQLENLRRLENFDLGRHDLNLKSIASKKLTLLAVNLTSHKSPLRKQATAILMDFVGLYWK